MERGLLQKQVAASLDVTVPSVLNLEKNRSIPTLRFLPKIIEFLVYDPTARKAPQRMGEWSRSHRKRLGLSRKRLAALLRTDQSNLAGKREGIDRRTALWSS